MVVIRAILVPFHLPGSDKSRTRPPIPCIRTRHQSCVASVINPVEPALIVAKTRMKPISEVQNIDNANMNI